LSATSIAPVWLLKTDLIQRLKAIRDHPGWTSKATLTLPQLTVL
jgi:hypothetical protein